MAKKERVPAMVVGKKQDMVVFFSNSVVVDCNALFKLWSRGCVQSELLVRCDQSKIFYFLSFVNISRGESAFCSLEKFGLVHFTEPQSMDYHKWTTEMDYPHGRLNGLPLITYLEKKKDDQSLVVFINNSKDSINKRFWVQLTSGKITH